MDSYCKAFPDPSLLPPRTPHYFSQRQFQCFSASVLQHNQSKFTDAYIYIFLLQCGAIVSLYLGSFGLNNMTATIPVLGDSMDWVQTYLKVVPMVSLSIVGGLLIFGLIFVFVCGAFTALVGYAIWKLCLVCCFCCCPRKTVKLWRNEVKQQPRKQSTKATQTSTKSSSSKDPNCCEAAFYSVFLALVRNYISYIIVYDIHC